MRSRGNVQILPLRSGRWGERGRASDVTTGCLFGVTEGGGMDGGAGSVWSGAASLAVLMASGPRAKYFVFGERRWRRGRAFRSGINLFLANSHQNSHLPKIKMAADLAAAYIIDFIGVLAPQVGLEPTTLRLTAECSAIELLRSDWQTISSIKLSERALSVKTKCES